MCMQTVTDTRQLWLVSALCMLIIQCLTAISNPHNPVRIICDSRLRTPLDSRIVKSAGQIPTIIATCSTDSDRKSLYENAGCEVIITKESELHVDLKELMNILGEKGIDRVILEGGGTLKY